MGRRARTRTALALLLVAGVGGLVFVAGSFLRGRPVRLLLVGLDGADWNIIRPMLDRGELPNLARLVERGVSGPLHSIEPLISPPIWTSIATGVKPERHGITWFMCDTDRPGERLPVTSTLRRVKAFWNVLSEAGRKVGVIGWWATFPAERVRGFLVSDFVGYHGFGNTGRKVQDDLGKTHPPGLIGTIRADLPDPARLSFAEVRRFLRLGEEEFEEARRGEGRWANSVGLFCTYFETAAAYVRIAERVCAEYAPEALALYFELPDATSHLFARFAPPRRQGISDEGWERFSGTVEEVYRYQDELLGRLLRLVGPKAAVFVVSDHGFRWGDRRPEEGDEVQIGRAHLWHEKEGILVAAGPGIRKGFPLKQASVLDVTPTILRYLGLAVAQDLDGSVLLDLFEPAWLEENAPISANASGPQGTGSRAEDGWEETARGVAEEQSRRLAALGYIGEEGGTSAEMRWGRVTLLIRDRKWEEAEKELEALLRKTPTDPRVRVALAEVYRATHRIGLARAQYETAASLVPENPDVWCGLGEIVLEQADMQAAEGWFRLALEKDGNSRRARLDLGHTLHLQERPQEAREEFEAALALEPRSFRALYNLGVLAQEAGDLARAEECYRLAAEIEPQDARARMNLGVLLAARGKTREGIEVLSEAARLAPADAEIRYNLGTVYLQDGMPEKAAEEFEEAIRANPDLRQAHFNLGQAYLRSGKPLKSLRAFGVAARLDERDPEARYAIAVVEASMGHVKEAREALEGAIGLGGEAFRERAKEEPPLAVCLLEEPPRR